MFRTMPEMWLVESSSVPPLIPESRFLFPVQVFRQPLEKRQLAARPVVLQSVFPAELVLEQKPEPFSKPFPDFLPLQIPARSGQFHRHLPNPVRCVLNDDGFQACFIGCHCLFRQAANRQYFSVQRNFTRHCNVMPHWNPRQSGNNRCYHRTPAEGPSFGTAPSGA